MALDAYGLIWVAIQDWQHGWFLRVAGVALCCTVPAVVAATASDFRARGDLDNLAKRLAWVGLTLLGLGLLELVVVFASWILLVAVGGGLY
jgi:hypothetical protein